jgi:hypothetical protein
MAAASGGLLFINGVGAIMGPLTLGYMLDTMGPRGYWVFLGVLMFGVGMYGIFRMTRRSRADIGNDNVTTYANFPMTTSPILAEMAQEVYLDAEETGEAALAEPAE